MNKETSIIREMVNTLINKGWTKTHASLSFDLNEAGEVSLSYAYLYPVAELPSGESLKAEGIYLSGWRFSDLEGIKDLWPSIHGHPTVTEFRTKDLLESIASIKDKAEALDLPADFINPLTIMAEQLRSNAIEKKEIL